MNMFTAHTMDLDDTVIVRCKGRLVRSEAAYYLRNVVQLHTSADHIALDLSAVDSIGGGGLGMLALLQKWADVRGIRLTILNPAPQVEDAIRHFSENTGCSLEVTREANILDMIGLPRREHWVASQLAA